MARLTTRTAVATTALAAVAVPAAIAASSAIPGADVRTDARCYLEKRERVRYGATGLPAGGTFSVLLDGKTVGAARTADAAGNLRGSLRAPAVGAGAHERRFTLALRRGGRSVSTTFRTSVFDASYSPEKGDPNTLVGRFRVYGFGPSVTVYVHYIRPNGRLRRTLFLGTTRGSCGHLVSGRGNIFPFEGIEAGTWRLQFDRNRRLLRNPGTPVIVLRVPIVRTS